MKLSDSQPQGNPPSQSDIDANNQRKFIKITKEYIAGYQNRKNRVRYTTLKYPDSSNLYIGILEIYGDQGPFTVLKEVPRLDASGKSICQEIEQGESWIRDGEDKRKLHPNEILTMIEDAKVKKRHLRKIKKAQKKLGDINSKWPLNFVNIDCGETPNLPLTRLPLRTKSELENCFIEPHNYIEILMKYGERWYLNNILISSTPGSGRTSLLWYLIYKREELNARGTPVQLMSIPSTPNFGEFIYALEFLVGEDKVNTRRTLIVDIQNYNDKQISFLYEICKNFPKYTIWMTCLPNFEEELKQVLTNSEKKTITLPYPRFINAPSNDFQGLVNKIFSKDKEKKDYLLAKENVVFRDLVETYFFPFDGISKLERFIEEYVQLSYGEQLILQLLNLTEEIRKPALSLLTSVLELPIDTSIRLSKLSLLSTDELSHLLSFRLVEKLPKKIRGLTNNDIIYILGAIKKYSPSFSFIEGYYLADIIRILKDIYKSKIPDIEKDFDIVIRKLRLDIYCKFCDAYFDSLLEYCPGCGRKAQRIYKRTEDYEGFDEMTVPFPDSDLLKKGSFKRQGVSSKFVHDLILALPKN